VPLSEKLSSASKEASQLLCKAGKLLLDPSLEANTAAQLAEILSEPNNKTGIVSNASLAQILREEGYDISKSMLDRHRGKSCTCFRRVSK
jgi:hypothetical protein